MAEWHVDVGGVGAVASVYAGAGSGAGEGAGASARDPKGEGGGGQAANDKPPPPLPPYENDAPPRTNRRPLSPPTKIGKRLESFWWGGIKEKWAKCPLSPIPPLRKLKRKEGSS